MANLTNFKKYIPISFKQHNNPFTSIQRALDKAMRDFNGWFEPYNFPVERFEELKILPAIDIV